MSIIELPQEMKEPYGITAVYLKQLFAAIDLPRDQLNRLIETCTIDASRINNDRFYRVPFFKASNLLEAIYSTQQDPMLAIKAVFSLRVKSFPVLGYAIVASSTLRAALERLALLELVVWDVGSIHQATSGDHCRLIWRAKTPISPLAVEMAISGWINIGRQLFATSKRLQAVTFSHACLGDEAHYRKFFGCDVHFNADENSILFPGKWLDEKLIDGDESLADLMTAQATALISNYSAELNIENTLRAKLFRLLPDDLPELEEMAESQQMSARQLRYLLNERGLNYRKIVDDVRKDVASYLLLDGHFSIGEIAGFCGFLEQSSFNRAFKRWWECSPSDYLAKRVK